MKSKVEESDVQSKRLESEEGRRGKKSFNKLWISLIIVLIGVGCQEGLVSDLKKSQTDLSASNTTTVATMSALPQTNLTQLDMPVSVSYELTTFDCSNNPGPKITFSGLAGTAGFGVRTIFRNNMDGTHTYIDSAKVDVALQPTGQQITIPKQPVLGGVGGNPFIWVQFINDKGEAVSGEIFIGRCVQGYTFKGAQQVAEGATASAKYNVSGCSNHPGPNITFDAGISYKGLSAVVIFRNNVNGPHEASRTLSGPVQVIPSGLAFSFPKQPVLGGVGGNPWIWTQFLNGQGAVVSDEILLGRCVQLSQALTP
jgi:hypothetical protein